MIQFQCPDCHHPHSVPNEASGRVGKCTECGARISVPVIEPPTHLIVPEPQQMTVEPSFQQWAPEPPPVYFQPVIQPRVSQTTHVHVHQQGSGGLTLGTAAMIIGLVAICLSWIPLIGTIGAGLAFLGLCLAGLGFLVSLFRGFRGFASAFAGSMICGLALLVFIIVHGGLAVVLDELSRP